MTCANMLAIGKLFDDEPFGVLMERYAMSEAAPRSVGVDPMLATQSPCLNRNAERICLSLLTDGYTNESPTNENREAFSGNSRRQ